MDPCTQLFLYCRAGFEREALAECVTLAKAAGLSVSGEVMERAGYVLLRLDTPGGAGQLAQRLLLRDLAFTRHLLAADQGDQPLTPGNRITQLTERLMLLATSCGPFSSLWLGFPDSDAGKVLAPLCRALQTRLEAALRERDLLRADGKGARAEIVFLSGTLALTGISWPDNGSLWPMGIPRLRLPTGSPSRAALKLEEAFWQLLSPQERRQRVTSGKTAVDLGAAPGGWSLILLRAGLTVTAVDRANLAPEVTASPRLRHAREDGFRFRPPQPVDWLLCDMVEQPSRIAELVSRWATSGWCRAAIFNLKLPMKKRHEALQSCRERILVPIAQAGITGQLRMRQLYHDREEVTGLLLLPEKGHRSPQNKGVPGSHAGSHQR